MLPALKNDVTLDRIDAASLLWRLELEGVDVGARWGAVRKQWAPHIHDHVLAFNDLHLAFAAARAATGGSPSMFREFARRLCAGRRGRQRRRHGQRRPPLIDAMLDFADQRYAEAIERILPLRYDVWRIGGSHAQRDIVDLTLHRRRRAGGRAQPRPRAARRTRGAASHAALARTARAGEGRWRVSCVAATLRSRPLRSEVELPCSNTRQKVLRDFWYATVPIEALATGQSRSSCSGQEIALFLDKEGMPAALEDRCCHRTAKLSKGWIHDGNIVCGYHGWEYDRDGKLVMIPQFPFEQAVPDARAKDVPRQGALRLCLGLPGRTDGRHAGAALRQRPRRSAASISSTTAGTPRRCG